MDTPTCTGTLAPPPLTTRPCMHRPVEQNLRRAVTVFSFSLSLEYQEGGRTHQDFWGQHKLWLLSEHEGVQGKWGRSMKEQKAEDKLTSEEKGKSWKHWKWEEWPSWIFVMENELYVLNLVEGTEQKSVKMLTEGYIWGTHYPSTLLPMLPSVVFILHSWQIRNWSRLVEADNRAKMASRGPLPHPSSLVALHWFHLLPWPKDCVYINQVICTG